MESKHRAELRKQVEAQRHTTMATFTTAQAVALLDALDAAEKCIEHNMSETRKLANDYAGHVAELEKQIAQRDAEGWRVMDGSLFGESFGYWRSVQEVLRDHDIAHADQLRGMLDERNALEKRVMRLGDALRWYANSDNYNDNFAPGAPEGGHGAFSRDVDWDADCGERARKVLEEEE